MHFHYSIYILFFVVIMLFSIYIDIRVCVGGGVYIFGGLQVQGPLSLHCLWSLVSHTIWTYFVLESFIINMVFTSKSQIGCLDTIEH